MLRTVGRHRNPSPPVPRVAMKLSMVRAAVAVQAAPFGSWNLKPLAT